MKVEQKEAVFQPVTITLETLQEVKVFTEILGAMTTDSYDAIGWNTGSIYGELFLILEKHGEKPEFRLKPILPE